MWPTPRANKIGGYSSNDFSPTLESAVKHGKVFPTPTSTERAGINTKTGKGEGLSKTVQLFPTPTKQDGENNGGPSQFNRNFLPLNAFVAMFPTPTVNGDYNRKGASKTSGDGLATRVKLLPTPTARNSGDCKAERNRRSPSLESTIKTSENGPVEGNLNPDWEELLMGYPVGWTDLDGPEVDLTNNFPQKWLDGTWEEDVPRLTTRSKGRPSRLKQLGNAVVPQIVELIGMAIIKTASKKCN